MGFHSRATPFNLIGGKIYHQWTSFSPFMGITSSKYFTKRNQLFAKHKCSYSMIPAPNSSGFCGSHVGLSRHLSTVFLPLSFRSCPFPSFSPPWSFIRGWTGTKPPLSRGKERNLRMPVFTYMRTNISSIIWICIIWTAGYYGWIYFEKCKIQQLTMPTFLVNMLDFHGWENPLIRLRHIFHLFMEKPKQERDVCRYYYSSSRGGRIHLHGLHILLRCCKFWGCGCALTLSFCTGARLQQWTAKPPFWQFAPIFTNFQGKFYVSQVQYKNLGSGQTLVGPKSQFKPFFPV